jgi:hypothetical protein
MEGVFAGIVNEGGQFIDLTSNQELEGGSAPFGEPEGAANETIAKLNRYKKCYNTSTYHESRQMYKSGFYCS